MTEAPAILNSIQVGQPQTYDGSTAGANRQGPWRSAIAKTAIGGPVVLGETGLEGDAQVDRQNHGGIDKAVLAYAAAHYDLWRQELPAHNWQPGGFGENLTFSALDELSVCLGDQYRIGDVLLEVSQPRQPCWKLCQIWGQPDLAKRVVKTGRTGWYLRVRMTGAIEPGQSVELVERPYPEWPLDRANRLMFGQLKDQQAVETLARLPQVSLAWREDLISLRMV